LECSTITPGAFSNEAEIKNEDESGAIDALSRSKKYCKISNEKRMQLINSVENDGEKIKQVGNASQL